MNNYVYITACLPVLRQEGAQDGSLDAQAVIGDIRSQLSDRDAALLDDLLSGFRGEGLDADFYRRMLKSRSAFLRKWFRYDLDVRNTKVEYLNGALGRPAGTDLVLLSEEDEVEYEDKGRVKEVLCGTDILARERGLDDLLWEKIDALTESELFSLDGILGFVAKLEIVDRWLKLDPQTGREMFHKMVQEIKKNAKI